MAQVQLYILNVVATPHPVGVYLNLLQKASRGAARARGSDYAKITRPKKEADDLYSGRILVWTEIDMRGRWVDLVREEELPRDVRDGIRIPDNARPNFRSFRYVFDEKTHRFYYEARNADDEKLGPTVVRRVLTKLMSHEAMRDTTYDVEVTIVPDEEAVAKIINLPGLKRLHIRLNRLNPDDFDQVKRRLLRDLENNKARRKDTEYVRARGEGRLTPTEDVQQLAEVAADNGFVEGESDSDGYTTKLSTREHPRKIILGAGTDQSVLARILEYVRSAGRRRAQRT